MEYVKYDSAMKYDVSSNCSVYEYAMKNEKMTIGVAEITNRYPDQGFVVNNECSEMGYILKGSGKLVTETETVNLSERDVVFIPPGEKYYWEGKMTVILPTTPPWQPQQHEIILYSDKV